VRVRGEIAARLGADAGVGRECLVVAEPSVADFEAGVLEHWLQQPGEVGVFVAGDGGQLRCRPSPAGVI
jgi:hypothetical protein